MGKEEGYQYKSKGNVACCWMKKSIFFDLEYWRYLHVRHNLDVINIKKNVCESIICILLNIQGKTKNGLNTHFRSYGDGLEA